MSRKTNPIQSSIWIAEQVILLVIAVATIGATIIELVRIFDVMTVNLSDLFLLFIYAEVLGMVGVFYRDNRIPVTLPIIIAITALCRLLVMQSKEMEPILVIAEAGAVLILSGAAYLMTMKDKISLAKAKMVDKYEESS